jgi:glycosyltransferase involved in cell wall biosynthesis
MVNPLDVDDSARGLREITTNENLRSTLIARGHQQMQKFTWQACADGVLAIFEKVLKPGKVKR